MAHVLVLRLMLGSIVLSQCQPVPEGPRSAHHIARPLKQGMCLSQACGIHFRSLAVQQVEVAHGDRAGLQFFSNWIQI